MFNSRGFTLIEVLISMVILAVGLLGLAAMQAMSLRDNQDAYYYQQATLLAYEMQDRILGNGIYWESNPIPSPAQGNSCNSFANACIAGQMAAYDYWYWQDSVSKVLPAPKSGAIATISASAVANTPCKKTYPASLCLITRWGRKNSTESNKSSKLSGTATHYLEVTP
jgi:type IV pilus assembly protein PilV